MPRAMWGRLENRDHPDSRETTEPRGSPGPKDPSASPGRRVPPETQASQVPRELMVLWVTRARRVPQERKGPRDHQAQQGLQGTLDPGA